jgi:hypothetical protein
VRTRQLIAPPQPLRASGRLYRMAAKGWERTDSVFLGDRILLTLRVERIRDSRERGAQPRASVTVFNSESRKPKVLLGNLPMIRKPLPDGGSRFCVEMRVGRSPEWLGVYEVLFHLVDGKRVRGVSLSPYLRVSPSPPPL